jgi:hypothetical protein
MKNLYKILHALCLLAFIGSCSIGIGTDNDSISRVGIFLFFATWLLGYNINNINKD